MGGRRAPIRSHVQVTLLCFLIVKLGLISIFVCTKRPLLSVPILETKPALATDAQEKAEESEPPGSVSDTVQVASGDTQDADATMDVLELKRAQIEEERRLLEEERKRLTAMKQEINGRLARLTEIQNAIQSKLDKQKTIHDKRIKHLIKIYTVMPPKKAAVLIENLDMEVIIALFSKMKGETVGQILPYMSTEKGAKISERLAQLRF
ncbi:MAG: hypothetical protein HWN68_10140 [Desulfobacterales bacterium]|nr:hypothetical protein [Desulfobacterales bacterium]